MEDIGRSEALEKEATYKSEVGGEKPIHLCDRCGFEMVEQHCKIVCPNCGARWDCSDLNIYTD